MCAHYFVEPVQELSLWESSECESERCPEAHCRGWEDCGGGWKSVCDPMTSSSSSSSLSLLSVTISQSVSTSGVGIHV